MLARWKRQAAALLLLAAGGTALALAERSPANGRAAETIAPAVREQLTFVRVGTAQVYRPTAPRSVAILLSGDGGWSWFNDRMARRLAGGGALVLGLDTNAYLRLVDGAKGGCRSAGADFQMLAQYAEQKLALPGYIEPVIVGYSAGATLAYIAAEEAPTALRGAISLSFPPDVLGSRRPFCTGRAGAPRPIEGGFLYQPAPVTTAFSIIQGSADPVVPPAPARAFAAAVPGARYIEVAGLGHNYAGFGAWWPAFVREYGRMTDDPGLGMAVADLPLAEVPASGPAAPGRGDAFAIFLSGDGGWADLDQQVAGRLAAGGIPVVGWSSLKYFWNEKPPARAAADLDLVIRAYARRWQRPRVLLVGYSFGADTLPAMIAHLPPDTRNRVAGLVSIAGSTNAEFQFSTLDWFDARGDGGQPVAPVLAGLKLPVLCVYGREDSHALCPHLPAGVATLLATPGGHHIGGDFGLVVPPMLALLDRQAGAVAAPVSSAGR